LIKVAILAVAFIIMIILFILPTVLTFSNPFVDGVRTYGFPLTYNTVGGDCLPPGCEHVFSYVNLIIDLLIVITIPIIVNHIVLKIKKN